MLQNTFLTKLGYKNNVCSGRGIRLLAERFYIALYSYFETQYYAVAFDNTASNFEIKKFSL